MYRSADYKISQINSPFTQIFSVLTKYDISENNPSVFAYGDEQLVQLYDHIRNSNMILLQGLGSMGRMLSAVDKDAYDEISIPDLGRFISATCNLIEALDKLQSDIAGQS